MGSVKNTRATQPLTGPGALTSGSSAQSPDLQTQAGPAVRSEESAWHQDAFQTDAEAPSRTQSISSSVSQHSLVGNPLLRGLSNIQARVAQQYPGQVAAGNVEAWQTGALPWKKLSKAERRAVKMTVRDNLVALPLKKSSDFNTAMDALGSLKPFSNPNFIFKEIEGLRDREVESAMAKGDVNRSTKAFERALRELPDEH